MAGLRNAYFNDLTADRSYVAWEPPAIPAGMVLPDPLYFGPILATLDELVGERDSGLTFYMTHDLERLPTEGMDVVAILYGDEFTRIPAYFDRVRAIFRVHAARPELTASVFREPSWMNVWWLVAYLRTWRHHLPGAARYRRARRRGAWTAPIVRLPVGTADQVELPLKPLAERSTDVFFAGSVQHRPGAVSEMRERLAPKTVARASMMRAAQQLAARHPSLTVQLVSTGEFVSSLAADEVEYSRRLMDARIALVPRGTTSDTYRLWQALRAGCVPIMDSEIRDSWFYDGVPAVRLSSWSRLEHVVVDLLADQARLEDLHRQALAWWNDHGSAEAVARHMAEQLASARPG